MSDTSQPPVYLACLVCKGHGCLDLSMPAWTTCPNCHGKGMAHRKWEEQ